MSINNIPNDFSSLLDNLKSVVVNQQLSLGPHLELIKDEKVSRLDFEQIVQKTEELFFSFLKSSPLSDKTNEHLPGRISVRLERIACLRCGMSLDQAQEKMQPFMDKVRLELTQSLPAQTIFTKPIQEGKRDHPPFYFEPQQKIMSCQLHAFNVVVGRHQVDLNDKELQSINVDADGIAYELISRISHQCVMSVSKEDFTRLLPYRSYEAFMADNGVHTSAYRKDSTGQWWKIDSLYKIGGWGYQIPVNLEEEELSWFGDPQIVVDQPEQFRKIILEELSSIGEKFKEIETSIAEPNWDVQRLKTKLSCFLFEIITKNFSKINSFPLRSSLNSEYLYLLQSDNESPENAVERLRQILLAIRRNQIAPEVFKENITYFRQMIDKAVFSLT